MKTKTFDPAEYLTTPEDVRGYLQIALEDSDTLHLARALSDVLRSQGWAAMQETYTKA